MTPSEKLFLPYQKAWIEDESPLKIIQKSRQVGITYADAYDSVMKASERGALLDVWISSRDQDQAKLYLEDCKEWATFMHLKATDLGQVVLDQKNNTSAYVLQFANNRRIYCLSSNPNALAGKRGHVKLDEFALHQDQRLLYKVAKPVTTWGGTLSIISTHRGIATLFNEIINEILHHGNPKKWSLHTVPIQLAVEQGLVEKINAKKALGCPSPIPNGRGVRGEGELSPDTRHLTPETNDAFLQRIRNECIDEEQWNQEYCCIPADESAAFITHEMITACEDQLLRLLTFEQLLDCLNGGSPLPFGTGEGSGVRAPSHQSTNPSIHQSNLYLGMDVARKDNLCVIDVGEKIGDVVWDRYRIELQNRTFSEIEFELFRLLDLPQIKRACIDATGMGMQLAERARERFGWKVEPITFTPVVKEELAFGLRRDLEDRNLRLVRDDKLRSDLRALRKEVTSSGNIRFAGESENSHCDRTWAKALRQHAARSNPEIGAMVG